MKQTPLLALASAFLAFAASSCIDDNYDLSDIDKTVQVNVDHLVIPVNIDQITLSDVIDETSNIKIIDGQYAYITDGTFESEDITIDGISVKIDKINDTDVTIKNALGGLPNPHVDIIYDIAEANPTDFSFKSQNISDHLVGLTRIDGSTVLKINLDLSGVKSFASKVLLQGVKMDLPKHLLVDVADSEGTYDYASGVFTLADQYVDTDKGLEIELDINGVDVMAGEFNPNDHTLNVDGQLGVIDGIFEIPAEYQTQTLPERLSLSVAYDIEDFEVHSVSGDLMYAITDIDIPEVQLNDIPDFLNQQGTNLILANPQLLLQANNPLSMYEGLFAQTGIEITANRVGAGGHGIDKKTFTLDNPFKIGGQQHIDEFDFVLAPSESNIISDKEYPNPKFVQFSTLGQVLSGDGLPKSLKVELLDPMVPKQPISEFLVGKTYPAVAGKWKFIAPFALKSGSCIMYSDTQDGWSSDDLDKVTITYLEVTVNVATDIPVGVQFTGQPIGKDGKPIAGTSITGATIKPLAKGEPVTIKVEMPANGITGLDGIKFEAVATAQDGQALSPDMKINLTNIRPCVSGYYTKEL